MLYKPDTSLRRTAEASPDVVRPGAQVPHAQCEHARQKYTALYENPDKKLKKIII